MEQTVQQQTELMASGDRIIDGGNSYYQDNLDYRHLGEVVPVSVLSTAPYSRFSSCVEAEVSAMLLSADAVRVWRAR